MIFHKFFFQKTLWARFMDEFQLSQGYKATAKRRLLYTTDYSKLHGTHFVYLRRMKG